MEVLYKYYENIQRRKFSPWGDVRLGGQRGKRLYLILNNITYVIYLTTVLNKIIVLAS